MWTFTPDSIDNVLNLTAEVFFDVNDDNVLSLDERRSEGISTTLFRCGNQDGLVGRQDTDNNSGNQLNTIRSMVAGPTGTTGFSSCTDFTGSQSAFAPTGVVSQ